jgi:hypothetical protein
LGDELIETGFPAAKVEFEEDLVMGTIVVLQTAFVGLEVTHAVVLA